MSLAINHNLMALNVARNLGNHYQELSVSTRRLSSGLRIGTAADDAAGLAVRELMRSDVSTLNQGIRNANDAISMIQTADGALEVVDEKLNHRMITIRNAGNDKENQQGGTKVHGEFLEVVFDRVIFLS